jgi:Zn-dependent peptidase ImmA (M78 family)
MKSFLKKISKLECGWNEVPLDQDTFDRLCARLRIKFRLMPLSVQGFYTCDKKKHYIAINSRLTPFTALFTMYHELGHFLMHSPRTDSISNYCGSENHSRDEAEADAFAYCAVLPLQLLRSREPEELADIYGSTFFMKRLEVYERYRI